MYSSRDSWHCEKCNADLTKQKKFKDFDPYYDSYYKCEKCGYINDFYDYDDDIYEDEDEKEREKLEKDMDWLNIVDLFLD